MKEIRYAEAHHILQRTSILRFSLSRLKAKQYQIAFIDGLANDNEYQVKTQKVM